ncbi:hypothetical protein [Lawsonia intracellularis]|uniref:hypothetical protein n=1 Tax=Lawsonia intracellularis TaxID=29546 RepID=UPI0021E61258|nr:hypothetical protein [Lawsonia intracellularis]UYH53047.1 hypothetical protein OCT60_00655 [Lawsonia intracellularis]
MGNSILQVVIKLSLFFFIILLGCGPSNKVNLIYPKGEIVLPKSGAPRVVVVLFHGSNKLHTIGTKTDGSHFMPTSPVTEWVSRSLAEELSKQGLQVSYARDLAQAKMSNPNYIVTGTISEVWVVEENPATFTAAIGLKVSLSNNKGVIYTENFNSSQERQSIPIGSQVEVLLSTTLKSLLESIAKKIHSEIH